mmetsp:Transcript_32672/g.94591  ORF Transcript_32672/g.94591 Transcript_32672/m.94591 type:complete len:216 (-) Transcript_32672:1001-1648(-)
MIQVDCGGSPSLPATRGARVGMTIIASNPQCQFSGKEASGETTVDSPSWSVRRTSSTLSQRWRRTSCNCSRISRSKACVGSGLSGLEGTGTWPSDVMKRACGDDCACIAAATTASAMTSAAGLASHSNTAPESSTVTVTRPPTTTVTGSRVGPLSPSPRSLGPPSCRSFSSTSSKSRDKSPVRNSGRAWKGTWSRWLRPAMCSGVYLGTSLGSII